jgi:hypothetical protein
MKNVIKLHDEKPLSREKHIKEKMRTIVRNAIRETGSQAHVLTRSDIRIIKECKSRMDCLWDKVKNVELAVPEAEI